METATDYLADDSFSLLFGTDVTTAAALDEFETMINSPKANAEFEAAMNAMSPKGSQQMENDASSPMELADFYMMLRSPRAYSAITSPIPMTLLSPKKFDQMMQDDAFAESQFHMLLRSPKVYTNNSASKLIKKSHKKATPARRNLYLETSPIRDKESVGTEIDVVPLIDSQGCSPQRKPDMIAPSTNINKNKLVKDYRTNPAKSSSVSNPSATISARRSFRSLSISTSISDSSSQKISAVGKVPKRSHIVKLRRPTVPVTPKLKCEIRSQTHPKILTSEERLILELEEAKNEERQRVQKAKKVFLWVKHHSISLNTQIKSKKELTMPTTPVSYLMKRKGRKICSLVSGAIVKEEKPVDESHLSVTQFEPFTFATDVRFKPPTDRCAKSPGISTAEAAAKFFGDSRSHGAPKGYNSNITEPVTPHFKTDQRARDISRPKALSTEQMQELEFKKMQSEGFKARPVDKRIFQSTGELGVPKVSARKGTEFDLFDLRCGQRSAAPVTSTGEEQENSFTFKARPMPTYSDMIARTLSENYTPTIAKSPKMSGGGRASSAPARRQMAHHSIIEEEKRVATMKALHPAMVQLTLTHPKEFRLETEDRGLTHRAHREQRQRLELAEENAARNIRANKMPVQTKAYEVVHSSRELTEFKEFKLKSLVRHSTDVMQQSKLQVEENEKNSKKTQFQARSLPRSTFEPDFVVELENKPPTVSKHVILESDTRAIRRREFDEMMAAKMIEIEGLRESAARMKLEAENKKIKSLRKMSIDEGGMSFRASSILTKDPYPARCIAAAPLTEPKSPAFQTMIRRTSREVEIAAALKDM